MAFYQCKSLETIIIPYGTTTIGEKAFYGCSNLSHIRVPSSVTDIGSEAFSNINSSYSFKVYENTYAYEYAINNQMTCSYGREPDSVSICNDIRTSDSYAEPVSTIKLQIGTGCWLKSLATLEDGTVLNSLTDTDFSWSISDTDVIQFGSDSISHWAYNDDACIEAKNRGTATITVKTSNGKTATCIVTVE